MISPTPKYQLWCDDVLVATMPLDLPPTVGEILAVIGTEGTPTVAGGYRVTSPLFRCLDPNRHESLIRKVTVQCVYEGLSPDNSRKAMDQMIRWERQCPRNP